MPELKQDAARSNYKFKGHTVSIPAHYTVGHTMDERDVRFANRQLASVIGNSLGFAINQRVKALQEANDAKPEVERRKEPFTPADLDAAEVQTLSDGIYTKYEIGVNNVRTGTGKAAADPVQRIADNIAWEKIKKALAKKNIKANTVKAEKRAALIAQLHEKDPSILVQARATFEGTQADDELGLDFSDVGSDTQSGDASTSDSANAEGNDSISGDAGTDSVPDSTPSSTNETGGETAADNGTSPSNPGTLGTTEEGTGQGTPAATEDNAGKASGRVKNTGAGIETPEVPANPGKGAFS